MSQKNDNLIVCSTACTSTGVQVNINGTSIFVSSLVTGGEQYKTFSMSRRQHMKKMHIHWSINGWCRGNKWLSHIWHYAKLARSMMTSSNGNIFRFTFVWGIHQSPVNSPHKGQWRGTLMFSLICAWTNGCVNNRDGGDLRRHRDRYDVTVMSCGSLERTAIVITGINPEAIYWVTSKSIVEWNIFRVRVGLGADWVDMYFIWYSILLWMITVPVSLVSYVYWLQINIIYCNPLS